MISNFESKKIFNISMTFFVSIYIIGIFEHQLLFMVDFPSLPSFTLRKQTKSVD